MPADRLKRSLRATFLGLAVNVMLSVAKFLAGFFGHSQALIADAVESLGDIFSSIIVWRAVVVASKPADEDHPYGHGKAEPLAAATVSVMLLFAAALIAYHSLHGILEPRVAPSPWTLDLARRRHRGERDTVPLCVARSRARRKFRRGNRRLASPQRRRHVAGGVHRHRHRAGGR